MFSNTKTTYDEAIFNVSLILLNSHFTAQLPRPYLPNVIEVGGMHIKSKANKLPTVCDIVNSFIILVNVYNLKKVRRSKISLIPLQKVPSIFRLAHSSMALY